MARSVKAIVAVISQGPDAAGAAGRPRPGPRTPGRVAAVIAVVALGSAASGCDTGSRSGSNGPTSPFLDKRTATASVGSGTAAGATSGSATAASALRAVAIGEAIQGGAGTRTSVFVSDAALTQAQLFMDTGSGFADTGARAGLAGAALAFDAVQAPPTARLQVRGLLRGAAATSNTIVVGPPPLVARGIQVVRPVGSASPSSAPVARPAADVAWASALAERHLVVVWRVETQRSGSVTSYLSYPETMVEVPGAQALHRFGDAALTTFAAGNDTRRPGLWAEAVYGLDATGWAATASPVQYLEVR